MKITVNISRTLVGTLFIISGLIKLNDPVGFSFKLKDYFAPDVLNLEVFVPYALLIAIFVVIFEVMLGVMLLLGYAKKFTIWSSLAMIVFFTFLTFYSAYFNKVTDCGCFGDAIKLTPWESFSKDIVLLILLLIIYFGRKFIQPLFSKNTGRILVYLSFIGCMALGYYVLQHLPIVDFRPYKINANITEGMNYPPNAPQPIFEYRWTFTNNGKEKVVVTNGDFPKEEGDYTVETVMVQEGYEPPIHDFTMERNGEDHSEALLNEDNLIIVVAYSLSNSEKEGFINIKQATDKAIKNGYKVIGLSASSQEVTEALTEEYKLNFEFYFCDETALKTIIRANPSLMELQKGTILQKLHWNDAADLQLETLPNAMPNLNFKLKRQLDSIMALDQKHREGDMDWNTQRKIDSSNMVFIEKVFKEYGYPGKSLVGTPTNIAAWLVIQHSDIIPTYITSIKEAANNGELPKTNAAMMEDRMLMQSGEAQIYGTQGRTINYNTENPIQIIWPINDPENVNQRRNDVGYNSTIEEYAKRLYGDDFKYKAYTLDEIEALNEQ
ncbi:MAG: DoxX family protein [Flavobacteriaceae bacterium]|nr:DoxX family protein [Flavobacteriaceae bacterium]